VALIILSGNVGPFTKIMEHLAEQEKVQGGKLRRILAQVQRTAALGVLSLCRNGFKLRLKHGGLRKATGYS
jgi:hypothetical protein